MRHLPYELGRFTLAISLVLATACHGLADDAATGKFALSVDQAAALDRISADSLRGHLSFLASDLLEGRGTPSRGLDIAAEYIAAQFRRAGLEPVGDDGYFQTATYRLAEPDAGSFALEFRAAAGTIRVRKDAVSLGSDPLNIQGAPLVKVEFPEALESEQVRGKAIVADVSALSDLGKFYDWMGPSRPALLVLVNRDAAGARGLVARVVDPERPRRPARYPFVSVHDPDAIRFLDALPKGPVEATVTLRLGEPLYGSVRLRNVVGLLRGSDPELDQTYVIVSAHYDHIGIAIHGEGDRIFNGANDDGSGAVSVIELASALATLRQRPKRSLVFLAFFGEEHRLLGSRYYAGHPVFPIGRTVAVINLEQLGRTDSTDGPQVAKASMTGIDYSDIGIIFKTAGEAERVEVYKHPRRSDSYFGASDNKPFAELGVPAHTLCVAYTYPDYHKVGDHWDKIDYTNLALIDHLVGRAMLMIADNPDEPKWNEANSRALPYVEARNKQRIR